MLGSENCPFSWLHFRYFLRSCTKLPGFNPFLSDNGLGQGDLGGSYGLLMESDQSSGNGALRAVDALDMVIL